MRIFITASFLGTQNKGRIERMCAIVKSSGHEDVCFVRDVEQYKNVFTDPRELMQEAKKTIQTCDAVMMEYDGPATGRMIEIGIAYALNKMVIIFAKRGVDIKNAVLGIADCIIEYSELEDIQSPLQSLATQKPPHPVR